MDFVYIISTNDKITIDHKINELIKKNKDMEVVYYDLLEVPVERLVEDLDTYNFLSTGKIIVGSNASFLSTNKSKTVVEHNLDILEKYIDNPNQDNILILVTDSLDKRKKLVTNILKKATLIEEIKDIHSLIKDALEDYQMDNKTEKTLIEYCGNDHERIFNEIEKLKLYKMDSKIINFEDVVKLVRKSLDDNIFNLADSILSGNKKDAFELYYDFILHGEQVVNIIRIVANKIRLIYQVKVLLNDGNGDQAISKLLKVHEYPVKLAREASYKYTYDKLLSDLEKLSKLDLDIKSGKSTGEVEFELLLSTI